MLNSGEYVRACSPAPPLKHDGEVALVDQALALRVIVLMEDRE
jgi:hypothetical protein